MERRNQGDEPPKATNVRIIMGHVFGEIDGELYELHGDNTRTKVEVKASPESLRGSGR